MISRSLKNRIKITHRATDVGFARSVVVVDHPQLLFT